MKNPYPAKRLDNIRLTGPDSTRTPGITRFRSAIPGSSIIRDALGLIATNCPELAQELVTALGAKGTEMVPDKNKQPAAARLDPGLCDQFYRQKVRRGSREKGNQRFALLVAP
jgi:hypothetical protein